MKRTLAFLTLSVFILLVLAACNTPQPLPQAPTPIPTLAPATLPPPGSEAPASNAVGVTFPAAAPSTQAGQAIYQAQCASCHGVDGKGQVEKARDFSDVDYVRAAAPVEFYRTVTGGKDAMPAFKDTLSDEERWNVTFFLWSFSVKPAQLAKGKSVFEANCVACHGADGKGAIPQAAKFNTEFVAKAPATQFYQSVSAGKGIMPAWQDRLSAEDRWAAIEYARAFSYQPLSK